MIRMAVLAPKGVFEDEDFYVAATVPAREESVRVLLRDDFARDCDEAV